MMSNTPLFLRPASAAIAAVLALSSTTALAQDGAPASDALASPVIVPVDPAAPATPPSDTVPPPVLPEVLRAPPVTPPALPVPDAGTTTTAPADVPTIDRPLPPVAPQPEAEQPVRPRAAATTASARTPAARATPAASGRTMSTERAVTTALPAAALPVTAPVTPPPVDPVADAVPAPAPVATAPAPSPVSDDLGEWALFGGIVGIGGIAAAAALSRRRRPRPEPEPRTSALPHEIFPSASSSAVREPARAVVDSPALVGTSVATLARPMRTIHRDAPGQLGRHEAMVDAGPTADNPFLTRRNRLRRARFLDRQEGMRGDTNRRYATR